MLILLIIHFLYKSFHKDKLVLKLFLSSIYMEITVAFCMNEVLSIDYI